MYCGTKVLKTAIQEYREKISWIVQVEHNN